MILSTRSIFPKSALTLFVFGFLILAPGLHAQLKIGTVDINQVFKASNKTRIAEAKINEAKNAAMKELNERTDAYQKGIAEINQLNQQLAGPALSRAAKTSKAQEREGKIDTMKKMEREITDFRRTREQQLQQAAQRAKEEIVQEITGIVLELVRAKKFDLVFDKSGASVNGFSPVLFARANVDFTEEVIAALAKNEKPGAASPSPAK